MGHTPPLFLSPPLYLCHSRLHFLCHQLFKPKCRPNFVPHRVVLPLATLTHEFRLNNIFGSDCTSLAPCIIYVYLCIISTMLPSLSLHKSIQQNNNNRLAKLQLLSGITERIIPKTKFAKCSCQNSNLQISKLNNLRTFSQIFCQNN